MQVVGGQFHKFWSKEIEGIIIWLHSGLVISILEAQVHTNVFLDATFTAEVAVAICKRHFLTRFMCGWKSTLLSGHFCLLC